MSLGLNISVTNAITGGPSTPVALGTIYDKTLGDNYSDWLPTNPNDPTVSFTVVGSDLVMAGTGGTGGTAASDLFQDFISLNTTAHSFTCLRNWKVRIHFTTGVINLGTTYGFSIGVISTNSFESRDSLCRMAQDSGGVLGGIYFYYGDASATGITNQSAPGGGDGYALASLTEYYIDFEQDDLTYTTTLYSSDGTTVRNTDTVTDSPPGGTVAKVHHNTGKFAIAQHGGTTTIHRVTITSNATKNPDYVSITDSLGYGGKASALSNGFIYQSLSAYNFTNLAGWADRAVDMETRIAEAIALNALNYIIECGSNDIKATTWSSTGYGAFQSMLSSIGPTKGRYGASAGARNDVDVTQVQTDMETELGNGNIDGLCRVFTITKQPANTNLLGAYNAGDGIHWPDAGHTAVATDGTNGLKATLQI